MLAYTFKLGGILIVLSLQMLVILVHIIFAVS